MSKYRKSQGCSNGVTVEYCGISVYLITDTYCHSDPSHACMCKENARIPTQFIRGHLSMNANIHSALQASPLPSLSFSADWNTWDADIRCESWQCLMSQILCGLCSEVLNMLPSGIVTHCMMKSEAHVKRRCNNKKLTCKFYLYCGGKTKSPTSTKLLSVTLVMRSTLMCSL